MTPDQAAASPGGCLVCRGSCAGFPQDVPDPLLRGTDMAKTKSTSETVKTTVANERLFDENGVLRYAAGDTVAQDDDTKLYTEAELAKAADSE